MLLVSLYRHYLHTNSNSMELVNKMYAKTPQSQEQLTHHHTFKNTFGLLAELYLHLKLSINGVFYLLTVLHRPVHRFEKRAGLSNLCPL